MTSVDDQLKELATGLGNDFQDHTLLRRELLKMRERQNELQALIKLAPLAVERSRKFVPVVGSDYQCPLCWVESARNSDLTHVPKDLDNDEHFDCPECGFILFL